MRKLILGAKKENSFSTVELIVSISIIVILGGMVLLNYGLQRDKMALDNAVNATVQSIRKVQGLALGQVARPNVSGCSDAGKEATNFAVLFKPEENFIHLIADKDTSKECEFETRYFSPSIKIDSISPPSSGGGIYLADLRYKNNKEKINNLDAEVINFSPRIQLATLRPVDGSNSSYAYVSFYRENLEVRINNDPNNTQLNVTLCIKSSCDLNKKTITINRVGMVEVK